MGYCEIKNPPQFTTQVDKWDKTTRDNGEEMAVPIEELLNNTIYNKTEIEMLKGTELRNITISASDWNNLAYTITDASITADSDIQLFYEFDSIPAAQKANIRGRCNAGELMLVAGKLPTSSITIEKIQIVNRK